MSGWRKPSPHVLKINCKGVFDREGMKSSVDCVIRNKKGDWVKGASGMIGLVVPTCAELWSIFYGLKLAWEMGNAKNVECDSVEAVNKINNHDPDFWLADLVLLIKNLENEAWESCVIQHVPADSNAAATALANFALDGDGGIKEMDYAPAFLEPIITAEKT